MCYATAMSKLIKKTSTLQSLNAKSTNIQGLRCPHSDNMDTATVITLQMQATRIADLLLAPSGLSEIEC
jgi:hypothetical protein